MLTGLMLISGLYLVANQLAFLTLGWLLDHIINYIILIVIIVFQKDIRRGLSRIGRQMVSPSRDNDEDLSMIDEVVMACERMAEKHTGALIVFEREADLAGFVEPGTRLHAEVGRTLLLNIFSAWPDNPLHDGAVIIKDSMLQQAGAVLPLSRNPELDKALGTRHRAGIGITEETDAIAIIVSEQRGTVNLAMHGVLQRDLSASHLKRKLVAALFKENIKRPLWFERLIVWGERFISPPSIASSSMAHEKTAESVSGNHVEKNTDLK
jgi:diadenylate cyclase